MARGQLDKETFMQRVVSYLPKDIPAEAVEDVECDPEDGENGGYSYWVYLTDDYCCALTDCQTIHEDNLIDVKRYVKTIYKL